MRVLHKCDRKIFSGIGSVAPVIERIPNEDTGVVERKLRPANKVWDNEPNVAEANDIKTMINLKIPLKEVNTVIGGFNAAPVFENEKPVNNEKENENEE